MLSLLRKLMLGCVCVLAPFVAAQTAAGAPQMAAPAAATPAPEQGGEIKGTVKSGTSALPGVSITATNTLTGKKLITSTDLDGTFALTVPRNGRYVIKAELAAFAEVTQEALINATMINATNRSAKLDLQMTLLSRVGQQEQQQQQRQVAGIVNAVRGMQSLNVFGGDMTAAPATNGNGNGDNGGTPTLPGMNSDTSAESVNISGAMGRTETFGMSQDELRDRIADFRDRMRQSGGGPGDFMTPGGGPGSGGGPGGPGGGPGGVGPMILGPGGVGGRGGFGRFNLNKPHGAFFFNAGNSIFNARPYSLTGADTPNPDYSQNRWGAFFGTPLKIPHVYDSHGKTFLFAGYNGSRSANPYDVYSTVPTLLERQGDFSQTTIQSGPNAGQSVQLLDPQTHLPIGNTITSISPQAQALLQYIPLPNLPGSFKNFHYSTNAVGNSDNVMVRLSHNFGEAGSDPLAVFHGEGGGGGGRRRAGNNLSLIFNYTRSNSDLRNPYPTLGGTTETQGLNTGVNWAITKGKMTHMIRFNVNGSRIKTTNLYAGVTDVASIAQIGGVSTNPLDWGVPNLSFTNFGSLNDVNPVSQRNVTFSIGDTSSRAIGKHNLRFGGDFRRIHNDIRSGTNARGTFTFTGFASGYDFADFLLGLPQLTSVQFGDIGYQFRGNAYSLFIQDDWRWRGNLSLNFGLRYEYQSPFSEVHNRIVNLDPASGFTAVAPVLPGQTGPFTGAYPTTLVDPDRNNFAPRIGIAWKPFSKTVVRAGYGINYNNGQYARIISQLAFQPPFAVSQTNIASALLPLSLADGFPSSVVADVTNNFAVDRNYVLGYVQVWNLNIQRELPGNTIVNIGYNGSKGTHLDMLRDPNRGPKGLLIAGVQPFTFESSVGDSIFHAGSVRVRKRMQHGLQVGGTYTYSKSIDNASSIGGGVAVVAQNDLDLAAERGLSSFDQRHRFAADYVYELPMGTDKWLFRSAGWLGKTLSNWAVSGDLTLASGTPFTPRIIGSFSDVERGTNGTLRAYYTGRPIYLTDPTIGEWFNTAAFAAPVAGQFGNAGRNSIIGPGTISFDMAMSKTVALGEMRNLELRVQATNIFNHPNYTSIDTVVNSPTFGQVIAVGPMRSISLNARYRF